MIIMIIYKKIEKVFGNLKKIMKCFFSQANDSFQQNSDFIKIYFDFVINDG